ncbi:MAG TPA: hypothetical protein VFL57_11870 [Bryobacteraceae bacterium]|nr:hypothetical protein [Bryobacteraceae bacterium]
MPGRQPPNATPDREAACHRESRSGLAALLLSAVAIVCVTLLRTMLVTADNPNFAQPGTTTSTST